VQVDQINMEMASRVTTRERLLTGCHEIPRGLDGRFFNKERITPKELTREMAKPVEHNADRHHGMCWLGVGV